MVGDIDTHYVEIIKKLDEHNVILNGLSTTIQLFIQKQEGINCSTNEKLDKVFDDVRGNGDKQGLKEKVNRLWDDAQSGKISSRAIYLAIVICVITSVLGMIIK